jgi:ribose 5-phosphate isomerase B
MIVAVGFDHAGFPLKQTILEAVIKSGHEVLDVGAFDSNPSDYPDFAEKVGQAIKSGNAERGILACGSGVGACIAANKMNGVYASVCHDTYSAAQGVKHDDMNVLCIGARVIAPDLAVDLVQAFLGARYLGDDPGGERLSRRVNKIRAIEQGKSISK